MECAFGIHFEDLTLRISLAPGASWQSAARDGVEDRVVRKTGYAEENNRYTGTWALLSGREGKGFQVFPEKASTS